MHSPDHYYVCEPNVKARLRTLTESSTDSQRNSADKLSLDVLLPNGVLLQMVAEQTISVYELKLIILGKVFDRQANTPRVGLMTNSPAFYKLTYICQQGSRISVKDDNTKLFELNMALPLFKMDKNEEGLKCAETETDIGLLIGHKLSTFEYMRSPEVNDFRWSVKVGTLSVSGQNSRCLRQTLLERDRPG